MGPIIKSYHLEGKMWDVLLAFFFPKVRKSALVLVLNVFILNITMHIFWNVVCADDRLHYKTVTGVAILHECGIKK